MTRIATKTIITILWVGTLLILAANARDASRSEEANLYRVRKIFLEARSQGNGDLSDLGMAAFRSLRPALKDSLLSYGFTLVDNSADADALMYGGNTTGRVALHGLHIDPPKHGFQFWLASTKYSFKWRTEFNISSRADDSEVGRKAVEKAARNLFKAWKKSAIKAGIRVGDKLP